MNTLLSIIEGEMSTCSRNTVVSETESVGKSVVSSSSQQVCLICHQPSNKEQFSEQNRGALKEVAMV